MTKEVDIVFMGATGFTGRLVVDYIARTYGQREFFWGLAGRNQAKLEGIAQELGGDIPIFIADSSNAEELKVLAKKAKVICSTVGPFASLGEELIHACAAAGTHYCDITGEVHWLRQMIDRHQSLAQESGAKIVNCCGFDSIPSDLGAYLLQRYAREKQGQPLKEIKAYFGPMRGGMSGGTIASIFAIIAAAKADSSISKLLKNPYSLNPSGYVGPAVKDQLSIKMDQGIGWTAPFLMAGINTRIVRRSAALMSEFYGPNFLYNESFLAGQGGRGLLAATTINALMAGFLGLSLLPPSRDVLQRFFLPKPGEGPSEAAREAGFFKLKLVGNSPGAAAADKEFSLVIKGSGDPGYAATARMLGEAAISLALGGEGLSQESGFLTPAVAMGDVLAERLQRRDFEFIYS